MLLEAAIAELPASFREVFLLREVEGLSTGSAHLRMERFPSVQAPTDGVVQLAQGQRSSSPTQPALCLVVRLTRTVLNRPGLSSPV